MKGHHEEDDNGFEKAREELDWDGVMEDFGEWIEEESTSKTRFHRLYYNMFHIVMGFVTAGLYLFVYIGWFIYKFTMSTDFDKHRYTFYKKTEESQ